MDYQKRLATLRERMDVAGVDLVYLTRGANLFYLTGIRRQLEHGTDHNAYGDWASGGYIGRDGRLVVLAPRMGGRFIQAEAQDKPWIDEVRLIQESEDPLDVMRQTIAALPAARSIAVDDHAWTETSLALRRLHPDAAYSLASALIMPMRMIKDADEVAAMRRASAVADLVYERTLPFLRVGLTEFEIAREIDYQFQLAGAEYTSFETGISFYGPAGGDHSSGVIRAGARRTLQPGDSITFDFGCVLDGYCSDFGRSAFVGEPSAEYLRVHDLVLQAQAAGIAALRAGESTGADANAAARKVIADAGYDEAFTHRLGHAIGVTVHEPPTLDVVDRHVLQANMLFTVEPSVFIPGKLGNRVEDVVLVTGDGAVILNRASHDLHVIDA